MRSHEVEYEYPTSTELLESAIKWEVSVIKWEVILKWLK